MDKILVINDCRFEGIIMKDILSNAGYEVRIENEYGAISQVKDFSPRVVIVNLIMKETTGDKLIDRIRELDKNIRCILSSSNQLKKEDFSKEKVNAIIQTPISKKNLLEAIEDGRENRVQQKFCVKCGGNIEEFLRDKVKFCPYCGEKV